jgi:hypothetical protein
MCQHKKNLYLLSRSSTDLEFKNSYKSYCKSLTKSITEVKKELGIKSKYYLITIKLKHCGILLKLKWTGMVTWTTFFVSTVVMMKVMTIKIYLIPSIILSFQQLIIVLQI